MIQSFPGDNSWGQTFKEIGQQATEGYKKGADEAAIRNALANLGSNASARDILSALTNTQTYGNEAKQQALQNYLGVENFEELKRKSMEQENISKARSIIEKEKQLAKDEKSQLERKNVKSIVNQLNIPKEQREALGETISQATAESLLKEQLKDSRNKKLTPFEKMVQTKNAEEYINLSKEIPKLESTLSDIDYARKLSDSVGLLSMPLTAVGFSPTSTEMESVSFTLMEPIVKIFNPSGPIAQQKLKMIQDKYTIKGTDAPWKRTAKLNALERFAKQALKRAEDKLALIKKYDGNPPTKVLEEFDRESDTMSDAMIDYELIEEEDKEIDEPNFSAELFKDQTATSPEGHKFYSDGTKWVRK